MDLSGRDVFLSYSRADRETARRFAQRLTDEGFAVWWDAALRSGETFDEVIESALRSAKGVVVLWSPQSVASRWVRAEATLADRANKLIPVVIEPCNRPIIFELMHTADLSTWDGSSGDRVWQSVVADLRRLVDGGEPAAVVPKRAETPKGTEKQNGDAVLASANPAPPRKVDNSKFSPVNLDRASSRSAEQPDDDSTRIYRTDGGRDQKNVHCLELTIGDLVEKRLVVGAEGLKIGRAAPSDVILTDARVSRSHCEVQLLDQSLHVFDLDSTNGTFVDGKRLSGSGVLPVGSVLKVGNASFRHEIRSSADV